MDVGFGSAGRASRYASLAIILACVSAADGSEPSEKLVVPAQSGLHSYAPERISQRTFYSEAGRRFEISVALPKAPPPAQGYPAFLVLDPQSSFGTLTEAVRNQESMFGPVVVIGVGYESEAEERNRVFDLSPPGTDQQSLPPVYRKGWGPVGGADAFLDFLQRELKPAIAASTPLDKSRQAIFGHSLGGLFVLHVLFTRPDAFDTYIAASPSIWWSNKMLLKELPAFLALKADRPARHRLLITMGGLEDRTNPEELRLIRNMQLAGAEDLPRVLDMLGNAAALAGALSEPALPGLEIQYVVFPDETHNSVIPAYLGRAARFALGGWYP